MNANYDASTGSKDVISRIREQYNQLSKSQKKISDFLVSNYDVVAFMTASTLARKVETSESTVVRFANALGYDGYPGMQKALQKNIKRKLTLSEKLRYSVDKEDKAHPTQIMQQDIDNIKFTLDTLDLEEFSSVVRVISQARRVFIYGHRSTNVLADYMGFYFNMVCDDVSVIKETARDSYDQLLNVCDEDVVIVLSFPRYSKKTYDIVVYVHKLGVTIVGITDSVESPLIEYTTHCLFARYNMSTFLDSLVAPMSLINALVLAVGRTAPKRVEGKIDLLEQIWKDYDVYKDND